MSASLRFVVGVLSCLSFWPLQAAAWNRSPAVEFAALPQPLRHPEGLCVDRLAGEFYVTDFDYQGTSATGRVAVFDQSGRLLRVLALQSSPALLGCEFRPNTHELYVLDFGASKVLKVDPRTGATTVFATPVPAGGNGGTTPEATNLRRPSGNARALRSPILDPESSAALRDRLVREIAAISSADAGAVWAREALPAK